MEPFITINGNVYPYPRRGLALRVATIVDASRNANGVMVGQRIGRDQQKIENLEWGYLSAKDWSAILREMERFRIKVRYPDMVRNTWTERTMYPGDRTAEPLFLDEATGLPTGYINCKVNLIDTGE